jgi:hypothetical protein
MLSSFVSNTIILELEFSKCLYEQIKVKMRKMKRKRKRFTMLFCKRLARYWTPLSPI